MLLVHHRPQSFGVQYLALRAIGVFRAAMRRFHRHRQTMRALRELSAMDDRALRDIGLSRCEVRGALQSGTDLQSWQR